MFESVEIKNFKVIKNLKIDKFNTINIFSGENSCGKTSILEALFLLSNFCNTKMATEHFKYSRNNIFLDEKEELKLVYNNFNYQNTIKISGKFNKKNISSEYSAGYDAEGNISNIENNYVYSNLKGKELLSFAPRDSDPNMKKGFFHLIKKAPIEHKIDLINAIFCSFHSRVFPVDIDNLTTKGKKGELINIIENIFGLKIKEIFSVTNSILVKALIEGDLPEGIDIDFLGGGVVQAINIFSKIIDKKIIFIDEIENGLHYKTAKKLLIALFNYAIENKIQVFMTTHSKEILEIIAELQIEDKFLNNITHNAVQKRGEKMQVFSYEKDSLKNSLEIGADVR